MTPGELRSLLFTALDASQADRGEQVTNQVVDMGLLTETVEAAKEVLGVERIAAVADKGYLKIEDIEASEPHRSLCAAPAARFVC